MADYFGDGQVSEREWAELASLLSDPVVKDDDAWKVTQGVGRSVDVNGDGLAFAAGVLSKNAGVINVQLPTPGQGQWFVIARHVNWAGDGVLSTVIAIPGPTTATTTAPAKVPDLLPVLATDPGGQYDHVLAWVFVNSANQTVTVFDQRVLAGGSGGGKSASGWSQYETLADLQLVAGDIGDHASVSNDANSINNGDYIWSSLLHKWVITWSSGWPQGYVVPTYPFAGTFGPTDSSTMTVGIFGGVVYVSRRIKQLGSMAQGNIATLPKECSPVGGVIGTVGFIVSNDSDSTVFPLQVAEISTACLLTVERGGAKPVNTEWFISAAWPLSRPY